MSEKPKKTNEKEESQGKEKPPEEEKPDPEVEKRYWERTMSDDDGFEVVKKK